MSFGIFGTLLDVRELCGLLFFFLQVFSANDYSFVKKFGYFGTGDGQVK